MADNTCRVCGTITKPKPRGRPQTYCGEACRRIAEFEIRRIQARLARLEDEGERCRRDRMGLTDQFGAQPEEQILDIERETAIANARLRELVDEK